MHFQIGDDVFRRMDTGGQARRIGAIVCKRIPNRDPVFVGKVQVLFGKPAGNCRRRGERGGKPHSFLVAKSQDFDAEGQGDAALADFVHRQDSGDYAECAVIAPGIDDRIDMRAA